MNQLQHTRWLEYPASAWRNLRASSPSVLGKYAIRGLIVSWLLVLVAVAAALIYREIDGPSFRDQAKEITRLQETVTRLESLLGDSARLVERYLEKENQARLDEDFNAAQRIVNARTELNNYFYSEISKIRVNELRLNLEGQVGIWGAQTDFDGESTWTLDGPGAQRQPDGGLAFSGGLWEIKQSTSTISPLDEEAANFLEALLSWQEIVPTPNPFTTTTPGEAEDLLSFALSSCVAALELTHGVTLHTSFKSEHAGDDVWHTSAWSVTLNLDYGTWAVFPLTGDVRPFDDAANRTQSVLASSDPRCVVSRLAPKQ